MHMQATAVVATPEVVTVDGLYFEDMAIGYEFPVTARQVRLDDVRKFAELTGDTNPIHLDPVVAADSPFGTRVAHGALVLSLATGLAYQLGLVKGTVIFDSITHEFCRPVKINDVIALHLKVANLEEIRRPKNFGKVTLNAIIKNQENKIVQNCVWNALVAKRL